MSEPQHVYLCIDLKTFYASVECADRGLDPFTTNLVVADVSRGRTTICLAVSPAMKALGVANRCRLYDIPQNIDYVAARPRMRHYMEVSARIYGIYLQYVSAQDIHVYSVDECFIDATPYLKLYGLSAREFADELRGAVLARTGITATAGIGTNLFLAKVALDITAKHAADGIGILDEQRFLEQVQPHRPITDIWGIGPGTAERLARYHVYDLRGVAALSEELLYREFGVDAEYLIDHAHGHEPCTIEDIHNYTPAATSVSNGQVLKRNYSEQEARTVMREMVDASVLELVERHVVASTISLAVGLGTDEREWRRLDASGTAQFRDNVGALHGSGSTDVPQEISWPGEGPRRAGKPASHGTAGTVQDGNRASTGAPSGSARRCARAGRQRRLGERTNSRQKLMAAFEELWEEAVAPDALIRRINVGFGDLLPEEFATCDLFTDVALEEREHSLQEAIIDVKDRYGKNALVRGRSLRPEATGRERNEQVGGHHA